MVFPVKVYFSGSIIKSDVDFSFARFTKLVYFWEAQFMGTADFQSARFTGNVILISARFSGKVDFQRAKFKSEANLWCTRFFSEVNFSKTRFYGETNFGNTRFTEIVNFSNARFRGEADFSDARFARTAEFSRTWFFGEANFHNSRFAWDTHFDNAHFIGEADFHGVRFSDWADFREAQFLKKVSFRASNFEDDVSYYNTLFSDDVDFRSTIFENRVLFNQAVFEKKVNFKKTRFTGSAEFKSAVFNGNAYFMSTRFRGMADFRAARFNAIMYCCASQFYDCPNFTHATLNNINFIKTIFHTEAHFIDVYFTGTCTFRTVRFMDRAVFQQSVDSRQQGERSQSRIFQNCELDFQSVIFDKPELVEFGSADFSRALFTNTDISQFKFTSIQWAKMPNWRERRKLKNGTLSIEEYRASVATKNNKSRRNGLLEELEALSRFSQPDNNIITYVEYSSDSDIAIGAPLFDEILYMQYSNDIWWLRYRNILTYIHHYVINRLNKTQSWIKGIPLAVKRQIKQFYISLKSTPPHWKRYNHLNHTYIKKHKPHLQLRIVTDNRHTWDYLERTYRELKLNYEQRHAYREMGDFHYGEKEALRRNPNTPLGTWALVRLYRITAGYGERVTQPLLWVLGVFIVPFIVYWWGAFNVLDNNGHFITYTGHWFNALILSAKTGFFLRPEAPPSSEWFALLVYVAQSVLSPVFLGLLALAVRQRLKR